MMVYILQRYIICLENANNEPLFFSGGETFEKMQKSLFFESMPLAKRENP